MKMATRGKKKTWVAEFCENLGILKEEKQYIKKGASILCTYTGGCEKDLVQGLLTLSYSGEWTWLYGQTFEEYFGNGCIFRQMGTRFLSEGLLS